MAFDYSDNPLTRWRRLIATAFTYSPIVAGLPGGARAVQTYDRPLDIRGDLEESDRDAMAFMLVPASVPAFNFNKYSDAVEITVRYTVLIRVQSTTDVSPAEYFAWHLGGALCFLYEREAMNVGGPVEDEDLDPSPIIVESIVLANTDVEKKLALEQENDGFMVACDLVGVGLCARGDMKQLSA